MDNTVKEALASRSHSLRGRSNSLQRLPQELNVGEISGKISENKKGKSMAHFLVKHVELNPTAPSQAKQKENKIKWSRDELIQMGVATKKKEDSMRVKNQVSSKDAVCFMHRETCTQRSQVQEPIGDHLFQCEHAWVNMLQS